MGSEEDPKDGGAVAGAVFGAVFIYIVRILCAIILIYLTNTVRRASSSSVVSRPSSTCARAVAAR
jgi:ribonuclease kappa